MKHLFFLLVLTSSVACKPVETSQSVEAGAAGSAGSSQSLVDQKLNWSGSYRLKGIDGKQFNASIRTKRAFAVGIDYTPSLIASTSQKTFSDGTSVHEYVLRGKTSIMLNGETFSGKDELLLVTLWRQPMPKKSGFGGLFAPRGNNFMRICLYPFVEFDAGSSSWRLQSFNCKYGAQSDYAEEQIAFFIGKLDSGLMPKIVLKPRTSGQGDDTRRLPTNVATVLNFQF